MARDGSVMKQAHVEQLRSQIAAAGPAERVVDSAVMNRVLAAAHFEELDRVPIWDFIDSWAAYQYFAPGETDPVAATAKVFNGLGIDMCRSIYMPLPPDAPSTDEDIVYSGDTRWRAQPPIQSLEELRAWQVQELSEEEAWQWVAEYVRQRDVFAPQTLLVPADGVGFHATYGLMGIELFSYALYDAPAEIERLIEQHNYNALQRAKAFAQAKPCPLFFYGDDIAFKDRAMFSPEVMHRLFYPYLRRLCEVLNEAGIMVIFHTDGYIMDIIEDLLACGIAGINPIEPLAGNDIGELKRRYHGRLILVGNVDCSQVLPLGTVEQIRAAVLSCLQAAGHGGGLFIGSSSEIVPATPLENILAFYEFCHDLGRYPLGGARGKRP